MAYFVFGSLHVRAAVTSDVPAAWCPAEGRHVSVALINETDRAWDGHAGDRLAYHWLHTDGTIAEFEGRRSPLPHRVEPGGSVELAATVVAPQDTGDYVLQWAMVREGVGWWTLQDMGPRVRVEGQADAFVWALVEHDPVVVSAGSPTSVRVRLRNLGCEAWSSAMGDALAYHWSDLRGAQVVSEGVRTPLPDASPGATVDVIATVTGPPDAGRYRLQFELLREDVAWFGAPQPMAMGRGNTNEGIEVDVGPPQFEWDVLETRMPRVFWAGRVNTAMVRIRNTGTATWSPASDDRLSYRIHDDAGRMVVAEGMRTRLQESVAPGEVVDVPLSIRAPTRRGRFEIEPRGVREHVAWWRGPTDGPVSISVRARWASPWLAAGLGVAWVALVAGIRWLRVSTFVSKRTVWALWSWGVCVLYGEAFIDLSGITLWHGARAISLGTSAWVGLLVLAVPRRVGTVAVVAAAAGALLMIADVAYVAFFDAIVPLSGWRAVHHLFDVRETVWASISPMSLWLLAVPLSAMVLVGGTPTSNALPIRTRMGTLGLAVCLCAVAWPATLGIVRATRGSLGDRVFSEAHNAGRMGILGAHAFQVGRAIRDLGRRDGALSEAQAERLVSFYREREAKRSPGPEFGVASGMSVIVVQVEALQGWAIGAHVGDEPVMPFLLEQSQRAAAYFPNVFDQTAQGRTSDAEYLALASNHPPREGALAFRYADNGFVTVAHALGDEGYATLSAHPYRPGFWNRSRVHPGYGFARSLFVKDFAPGPHVGWGLADGPFLAQMAERLAGQPRPFFAFLVTLGLHHPYAGFPRSLRELDLGVLADVRLENYLHSMRYFDSALQRFFATLRDSGLADDTVVVVYGDHGAGLGHGADILRLANLDQELSLAKTRLSKVPLFIWAPGNVITGPIDTVGGQVDIGPTVLHVLGVRSPCSFVGRPLWDRETNFAALPLGGATTAAHLFVQDRAQAAGVCWDERRGVRTALHACQAAATTAQEEREFSRQVLTHDLYRKLADTAAR